MLAVAPDAEPAAHDDRPVAPRKVELVQRLRVQRRRQSLALGALAREGEHVLGYVHAVDIEPGVQPRDEQPAGSAGGVERGLAALHEAPEVLDLGALGVELRPVTGDHAVVPGLRHSP